MSQNKVNVKKRYWAFVCYPESLPDNWIEILQATGLPIAVSPLHDRDFNPDGEPKKAHYHVILCYAGPTTFNSVKSITDALNAPIPQALESVRGNYRYLCHEDNPEKFQYEKAEIRHINGFSIADFIELTKSEVEVLKLKICHLIRELDIYEYSDIIDYLIDNDMSNELNIASCHTIYFNAYITSRRHKLKDTQAYTSHLS